MEKILLSIVVPCFNEEKALPYFYEKIKAVQNSFQECGVGTELIFVDDGSRDNTASALKEFGARDSSVRYVIFSRNFGKESALLAGLERASGQYVVTMDADGQDPPDLIPQMFDAVCMSMGGGV
jgi:glycosyltransferase involved in cell wall biosynthesis